MSDLESNQVSIENNEARVSNEGENDSKKDYLGRLSGETDGIRVSPGAEQGGGESRVLDGSQCRETGDSVDSRDEINDIRVLNEAQGHGIGDFSDSRVEVLSENEKSSEVGETRVLDGTQDREIGGFVDSIDEVPSENEKCSEIDEIGVSRSLKQEGNDAAGLSTEASLKNGLVKDGGVESSEIDETRVSRGLKEEGDDSVGLSTEASLKNGLVNDGGIESGEIDETRISQGLKEEEDDSVGLSTEASLKNGLVNDGGAESSEIDETRVSRGLKQERDDSAALSTEVPLKNGLVNDGGVESRVLDKIQDSFKNDLDGDGGAEFGGAVNKVVTPKIGIAGKSEDGRVERSIASTSDIAHEGKHAPIGKGRKSQMDGTIGEFKLEKRSDVGVYDVDVGETISMKVLDTSFEMGDMVWGKVKSHPWWPGHIFHEALATSSVRRTRREGHVLVAFFGDSSYGWFHPLDLIPYDPNFTEKSQQTTAKNFVNAVEESIDEVSKRSALGLSCRCRNARNFRPTNIPGYLAVDVVDYDPNEVYSVTQIHKARESFRPAVTLSFIKQLAIAPKGDDSKSLDFIKQKATALAYRRSMFEEFDETYSQAFGHESVGKMPQPSTDKGPFRAHLSGPLVVADAVSDRKGSIKVTKSKDKSKRDKYLQKRRAEAENSRVTQANQVRASSSALSACDDGAFDSAAAIQKSNHSVTTNGASGRTVADQLPSSHHMTTEDAPPGLNKTIGTDISGSVRQLEPRLPSASEPTNVHHRTRDNHISSITSDDSVLVKKKKKALKRSAGDLKSEKSDSTEKKKKKMRKTDFERPIPSSGGTYSAKPEGRTAQTTASSREDTQINNSKKEDEVSNSVLHRSSLLLEAAQDMPKMLADLQGLALNPLHSSERSKPSIVRKLFLKFRSLVFQKASSAEPESDDSPAKKHAKPSKHSVRSLDPTKGERKRLLSERQEEMSAKRLKKIKEVKSLNAEKRAFLKNTETYTREGKDKVSATQQPLSKSTKPEKHTNLSDRAQWVEEPTFLMMKFPAGSSLPSLTELKARFARFGPLDASLNRVFYKTNTCRVAFMYKQDASFAYRYAVGNKSVFSNVKCMLKLVTPPEPQQPSGGKSEDAQIDPSSKLGSSAVEPLTNSVTPLVNQQPGQQLKSCLKKPTVGDESVGPTVRVPRVRFIMDEDRNGSRNKEGGELPLESVNAIPSSSVDGASSSLPSSSVAMDVSINQRFTSSVNYRQHNVGEPERNNFDHNPNATTELSGLTPMPFVSLSQAPQPLPPPPPPPPLPSMDISQQMMNLLTKCHDVVNKVNNILGYVPYHSL